MPKGSHSKDPGKNIKRLAHSHPEMTPKQRVAVGMKEAREAGGKVKRAPAPKPRREAQVKAVVKGKGKKK